METSATRFRRFPPWTLLFQLSFVLTWPNIVSRRHGTHIQIQQYNLRASHRHPDSPPCRQKEQNSVHHPSQKQTPIHLLPCNKPSTLKACQNSNCPKQPSQSLPRDQWVSPTGTWLWLISQIPDNVKMQQEVIMALLRGSTLFINYLSVYLIFMKPSRWDANTI